MSEHMTAQQLADAVREAHRDNDTYDVDHYCTRLTKHITQLERELAEAREDTERLDWLCQRGLAWRDCYGEDWKEGEWLYMNHHARLTIDEAMKEASDE